MNLEVVAYLESLRAAQEAVALAGDFLAVRTAQP